MATHTIATGSAAKLFSLKANFFNDSFVPASPVSNYGFHNPIITYVNADGSIDVAWLDYAGAGSQSVAGLSTPHGINITHVNPDLSTGHTTATGLQSHKLLGFTRDTAGAYYIAYTADHSYKTANASDANNVSGNALRLAKSNTGSFMAKAWDTLIFGDQDNKTKGSKGNAGAAGSGVLAYDAVNQKLLLYVAHQMAWDDNAVRHQAGYVRYVDPATGKEIAPGGASAYMGTGWFYSHNFNQRLLMDNGTAYLLAHGDAYSRQLGFAAFNFSGYTKNDSPVFNKSYLTIDGAEGDNATNAQTGQLIKLANGNFAIAHTTAQGRAARDVRIVIAGGADGVTKSSAWLTSNANNVQAIMPKLESVGSNILVTYGLWNSSNRTNKVIEWRFALLDANLKVLSTSAAMAGIEFVTEAPLIRFVSGPNTGRVAWVSGNDAGSLSVNLVQTPQ
ncbi:MAG: hypothetical protein V4754_02090 [Pseudomonadota bacterium]